jgi:DNA gyrase subunit A
VREFVHDQFIVMVTRCGVIKKCELSEFDNPMSRGIIALSLDETDELIAAGLTRGDNFIFLASHQGKAIRFNEQEVRAMGRPARGVRAMTLTGGDYLIGMEVVELEDLILSVSETTSRVGNVVSVMSVKEDTDVMIITKDGKIIRIESAEIRQAGRSTQGVRLVKMEEGDTVAAACVIPDTETEDASDGAEQTELPL